jgi:hypothetical protein
MKWIILALPTLSLIALPVKSAQIYECVAFGGGDFYSTDRCSEHRAAGRVIHQVPDGLPFNQQVDLINKRKNAEQSQNQQQEDASAKRAECRFVADALQSLDQKYAKGDYVEINEVNRDQRRNRELKSKQSSLGCFSK